MIKYGNSSDTAVIILHEIYGINRHIKQVCKWFADYGFDSIAPDLLTGREAFAYSQEKQAYDYFKDCIGFDNAFSQAEKFLAQIRPQYRHVFVLGYSIGATVAWRCSGTGLCDASIGLYGSRIRDYLFVQPKCPVLLLFPAREPSFSVDNLIFHVSKVAQVRVIALEGEHGFADPFSAKYNKLSAAQACSEIEHFITKCRHKDR